MARHEVEDSAEADQETEEEEEAAPSASVAITTMIMNMACHQETASTKTPTNELVVTKEKDQATTLGSEQDLEDKATLEATLVGTEEMTDLDLTTNLPKNGKTRMAVSAVAAEFSELEGV